MTPFNRAAGDVQRAMKQGHSGSSVERKGHDVEKRTSYHAFAQDLKRQSALMALALRLPCLPAIHRIEGDLIVMEFVDGTEGLTAHNAHTAGSALKLLHDESDYEYRCETGVDWVLALANKNLEQAGSRWRIAESIADAFLDDALIHSEPTQVIQRHDDSVVFIDIEGIGRGSRYRDLGFVEYVARRNGTVELLDRFLDGYDRARQVNRWRMRQMSGITALAYARYADTWRRTELGLQLIREAERHLPDNALVEAL
jgi:hypothetical protein